MKKCFSYLAVAALGVSASAAFSGAYIGAAVGQSELDAKGFSDFNSGNSVSLTGGYRINKHLAVEVSYIDLGEFNNHVSQLELLNGVGYGEVDQANLDALDALSTQFNLNELGVLTEAGFDLTESADVDTLIDLGYPIDLLIDLVELAELRAELVSDSIDLDVETDGFNVAVVGILPIGKRGELYAKIGAFMWDSTLSASGFGEIAEDDGTDLSWGLGLTLNVTEQVSVALEYQRFDVGDVFDATDMDVSNISFGARYNF